MSRLNTSLQLQVKPIILVQVPTGATGTGYIYAIQNEDGSLYYKTPSGVTYDLLNPQAEAITGITASGQSITLKNATGGSETIDLSGSVAGSDTWVQFNSGGTMGAESTFVYDYNTNRLGVNSSYLNSDISNGLLTLGYNIDVTGSTDTNITLFGHEALSTHSGGTNRASAFGYRAGYNASNINDLSVFGASAGNGSSAQYGSFFGSNAGQNAVGTNISAFGYRAGNGVNGLSATVFGSGAGQSATSDYIVAIGASAGANSTTDNVVLLGYQAGQSSTGTRLTALGYQAGTSYSGTDGIFIGHAAGGSNTYNNALVIGNNSNTTANNIIALGHNVTATATNTFVIPTTYSVGFGTLTPSEKLDVDGAIKIGTTSNTNAGAIRYLSTRFQGYNGTRWVYLDEDSNASVVSGNIAGTTLTLTKGDGTTITIPNLPGGLTGAINGLNVSGNDVALGGTLATSTTVDGNDGTYSLDLVDYSTASLSILTWTGNTENEGLYLTPLDVRLVSTTGATNIVNNDGMNLISLDADRMRLFREDSFQWQIDDNGFTMYLDDNASHRFLIDDGRATTRGLEYAGDYRSGFQDNTLVTKLYVDENKNYLTGYTVTNSGDTLTLLDMSGNTLVITGLTQYTEPVTLTGVTLDFVLENGNVSSRDINLEYNGSISANTVYVASGLTHMDGDTRIKFTGTEIDFRTSGGTVGGDSFIWNGQNLYPAIDNQYGLGTSSKRWTNLYVSDRVITSNYATSVEWYEAYEQRGSVIAGTKLSWDGSKLNVTGVTNITGVTLDDCVLTFETDDCCSEIEVNLQPCLVANDKYVVSGELIGGDLLQLTRSDGQNINIDLSTLSNDDVYTTSIDYNDGVLTLTRNDGAILTTNISVGGSCLPYEITGATEGINSSGQHTFKFAQCEIFTGYGNDQSGYLQLLDYYISNVQLVGTTLILNRSDGRQWNIALPTGSGSSSGDTYVTGGTVVAGPDILFTLNDGSQFTVSDLPDTYVTGGTYDNGSGTLTIGLNDETQLNITGFSSPSGVTGSDTVVTGGTVVGNDILFTNNSGNTFTVSNANIYTTGATLTGSNAVFTLNNATNYSLDLSTIHQHLTGATLNGTDLELNMFSGNTFTVDLSSLISSGSGDTTMYFRDENNATVIMDDLKYIKFDGVRGMDILWDNIVGGNSGSPYVLGFELAFNDGNLTAIPTIDTTDRFAIMDDTNDTVYYTTVQDLQDYYGNQFAGSGLTYSGGMLVVTGGTDTYLVSGVVNGQFLDLTLNDATIVSVDISDVFTSNDTFVTGGTYSSGDIIFTNNSGNTFTVLNIPDVYSTGGTLSGTDLIVELNDGSDFTVDLSGLAGGYSFDAAGDSGSNFTVTNTSTLIISGSSHINTISNGTNTITIEHGSDYHGTSVTTGGTTSTEVIQELTFDKFGHISGATVVDLNSVFINSTDTIFTVTDDTTFISVTSGDTLTIMGDEGVKVTLGAGPQFDIELEINSLTQTLTSGTLAGSDLFAVADASASYTDKKTTLNDVAAYITGLTGGGGGTYTMSNIGTNTVGTINDIFYQLSGSEFQLRRLQAANGVNMPVISTSSPITISAASEHEFVTGETATPTAMSSTSPTIITDGVNNARFTSLADGGFDYSFSATLEINVTAEAVFEFDVEVGGVVIDTWRKTIFKTTDVDILHLKFRPYKPSGSGTYILRAKKISGGNLQVYKFLFDVTSVYYSNNKI